LSVNPNYEAVFWNPENQYIFKNKQPPKPKSLRVYEAHGTVTFDIFPLP
jgi:1,4-alpha-glucan branching enzyme